MCNYETWKTFTVKKKGMVSFQVKRLNLEKKKGLIFIAESTDVIEDIKKYF